MDYYVDNYSRDCIRKMEAINRILKLLKYDATGIIINYNDLHWYTTLTSSEVAVVDGKEERVSGEVRSEFDVLMSILDPKSTSVRGLERALDFLLVCVDSNACSMDLSGRLAGSLQLQLKLEITSRLDNLSKPFYIHLTSMDDRLAMAIMHLLGAHKARLFIKEKVRLQKRALPFNIIISPIIDGLPFSVYRVLNSLSGLPIK